MPLKSHKKPYQVQIQWLDAIANPKWFSEEDILPWLEDNHVPIVEVGWLLYRGKEGIILASRMHKSLSGEIQWGMLQWIPSRWIVSMKRIKVES